jgi:small-conductance mechanosensitive channel
MEGHTVMIWLENLGFKATSLIAGLGIGGLAIALAAQKPIENLIGAITLFSSAPVRVGDFCRFGDKIGTVEEIGLRATKIRTLGRTTVYVPNAAFADLQLENFAYLQTADWNGYLEVAEDLNLQIMDIIVKAGTALAYPTQTVSLEQGSGPNEDAARAAEEQVEAWRRQDELYLPAFPDEKISQLRGTLPYPPEGGVKAAAT